MSVGDLVMYATEKPELHVPGLVVGIELVDTPCRAISYLLVQWLNWEPGELAIESERSLMILSSV
jgi:hypothetical protein